MHYRNSNYYTDFFLLNQQVKIALHPYKYHLSPIAYSEDGIHVTLSIFLLFVTMNTWS